MSLEKPWEKPFNKLIGELQKHWETRQDDLDTQSAKKQSDGVDIWGYGSFGGNREKDTVLVTISEFPYGDDSTLSGSDNCEFLRLSVRKPLQANLTVRHEGFADRFMKTIKIQWEFQTGDQDFDRKYFFQDARYDSDRAIARSQEFRDLLPRLEPFASVALSKTGAHLSVAIEDESVLTFQRVNDSFELLSDLIRLAQKHMQSKE